MTGVRIHQVKKYQKLSFCYNSIHLKYQNSVCINAVHGYYFLGATRPILALPIVIIELPVSFDVP